MTLETEKGRSLKKVAVMMTDLKVRPGQGANLVMSFGKGALWLLLLSLVLGDGDKNSWSIYPGESYLDFG